MDKIWKLLPADDQLVGSLSNTLGVTTSLARILTLRGISSLEEAQHFFSPKLQQQYDPYLMKDMDKAVNRIIEAINKKQRILLYGDYDVDGTTAVAVVCHFLLNFTQNVLRYIPNRFSEGYGISDQGINFAIEQNVELIISLDCGIKSHAHILKAKQHNIDTIICDHHLPEETVPDAYAILNPKQHDCNYPFKELCGCGIGYKLISALEQRLHNRQDLCYKHLDLVATAIAADIVPIIDENRILAYWGLRKANEKPCTAISALKQSAQLQKPYTITELVFTVAPRVNAAGRMDDAHKAVNLFMSTDLKEAMVLAHELNVNNDERKAADKEITDEAFEMLQQQPANFKSTVLQKDTWHKGVVGIVASRLIERKYQPTIILTESNGKLTGSARSIPGFNLFEGLSACAEYLDTFGGHYFAAGLTLPIEKFDAFKNKFDEVVQNTLSHDDFIPKINVDAEISLSEINEELFQALEKMAPHGPNNMRPVFVTKQVRNYNNYTKLVKEKHIKFNVQQGNTIKAGIGFNMADKMSIVEAGAFDICYHLEANEWQGRRTIEMRVLDIRPSQSNHVV